MSATDVLNRINALPCWDGPVEIMPLVGGITNVNYRVNDTKRSFVVRVGNDIPEHQVMRFNELACARAAHAAGVAPALIYTEPELTVIEFIESRTLTPEDVRSPDNLPRILDLLKRFHRQGPKHLRGPALIFWVFHVIRDYGATLAEVGYKDLSLVRELVQIGNELEVESGPFDLVLGHNDLLAANLLDDGKRLWVIDFDYAGFNSPLFDLGGLASNNELSDAQEIEILENYFEKPVTDALQRKYTAMKCASLLRETMWSMVSQHTSKLDFDYETYTQEYLNRFRAVHESILKD